MNRRGHWSWQGSVKWTHLATGLTAEVEMQPRHRRNKILTASNVARKWLFAKVWGRNRDRGQGIRVRSWHFDTYLGVEPFVKNELTGKPFPLEPEMLNGNGDFERMIMDSRRAAN